VNLKGWQSANQPFRPENKFIKFVWVGNKVKDQSWWRQQKQPIAHWRLLHTDIYRAGNSLIFA
jgi:hypothetical protein